MTKRDNIEILTVNFGKLAVTSVYKPPGSTFAYEEPETFSYEHMNVVIGDFNRHSTPWGYEASNEDGNPLEECAEVHHLDLIHDAKLPPSLKSCRWRRVYNPDLDSTSDRITVLEPIPHSQHRPISIAISNDVVPQKVQLRRRFNFQKADWEKFARSLDVEVLESSLQTMTSLSRKSRKPPGSASHAGAGDTTYLASHLIVPHYMRHTQNCMRKIPSQKIP